MPSECCECCGAFLIEKVFKGFASVAGTLEMLRVLCSLQIVAHPLSVARFAVPSWCCEVI